VLFSIILIIGSIEAQIVNSYYYKPGFDVLIFIKAVVISSALIFQLIVFYLSHNNIVEIKNSKIIALAYVLPIILVSYSLNYAPGSYMLIGVTTTILFPEYAKNYIVYMVRKVVGICKEYPFITGIFIGLLAVIA